MQKENPDNSHQCHSSLSQPDIFPTQKKKNIYLFMAVLGLCCCKQVFSRLQRAGATLTSLYMQASHGGGFPCCRAWEALQHVVSRALGHEDSAVAVCGLSSCGSWAQLLHSRSDLPGPGIEPMSPALAGGFLTTGPPEESFVQLFRVFLCLFV